MQSALAKTWKVLRYILASVLTLLLVVLIFLGIIISSLGGSLTSKDTVQGWLTNPVVHENLEGVIKEGLINTAVKDPKARQEALEQLNDPELERIFNEVITKEKYDEIIIEVTNGFYAWLDKQTPKPEFKVQIVEDPTQMQKLLVVLFTAKAEQLPACEPGEAIEGFDPLGTDCWPRGVPYEIIAEEIEKNKDAPEFQQLLNSATLDSRNLDFTKNIESPENIQTAFRLLQSAPLLFGALWAMLSFLVLVLIYNWQVGLKWLGLAFAVPAGTLLLVGLVAWAMDAALLNKLYARLTFEPGSAIRTAIETVAKDALSSVSLRLAACSALVAAFGGGLLGLRHYLFRGNNNKR